MSPKFLISIGSGASLSAVVLAFVLAGAALGQTTEPTNGHPIPAIPKKARTAADYLPRTLAELTAIAPTEESCRTQPPEPESPQTRLVLNGHLLPSRIRVTYLGAGRPMPTARQEIVQVWARRFAGAVETYTKPYQTEVLVRQNGVEYWLAVRQKDLPRLKQEFKTGDAVDLSVIRVGGVKVGGVKDGCRGAWVVLVEGFQK